MSSSPLPFKGDLSEFEDEKKYDISLKQETRTPVDREFDKLSKNTNVLSEEFGVHYWSFHQNIAEEDLEAAQNHTH